MAEATEILSNIANRGMPFAILAAIFVQFANEQIKGQVYSGWYCENFYIVFNGEVLISVFWTDILIMSADKNRKTENNIYGYC